jgi:hypothetical protein
LPTQFDLEIARRTDNNLFMAGNTDGSNEGVLEVAIGGIPKPVTEKLQTALASKGAEGRYPASH